MKSASLKLMHHIKCGRDKNHNIINFMLRDINESVETLTFKKKILTSRKIDVLYMRINFNLNC